MNLLHFKSKKQNQKFSPIGCGMLAAGAICAAVNATPHIKASTALQQYNLIVLGNYAGSNSDVQGTAFVAGNLSGTETFGNDLNNYSGTSLTVGGSITSTNIQVNQGNVVVGGNVPTAWIPNSHGTVSTGQSINVTAIEDAVSQESAAWETTASNGVTVNGPTSGSQYLDFVINTSSPTAVVDISSSVLNNLTNAQIEFTGLASGQQVVVNVDGTTINTSSSVNFNPVSSETADVLWNFYNATSINFSAEFYGSVLAPDASITSNAPIDGSVAVNEFNTSSEVHLPLTDILLPPTTVATGGPLPVPASFGLVAVGSVALLAGAGMRKSVRI
jgi:choice-of-anchor A domain-containing protein